MTESNEGGAPTVADAIHAKSGVGSSSQDPVELPDLSAFESRVRALQKETLGLVCDIPKSKKSITRNCKKLTEGFRLLLAAITHNQAMRVYAEPAVSGVEYTDDLRKPTWCSHETGGF